jgi:hypothetical protein
MTGVALPWNWGARVKSALAMDVSYSGLRICLQGLPAPSEKVLYRAKVISWNILVSAEFVSYCQYRKSLAKTWRNSTSAGELPEVSPFHSEHQPGASF